MPGAPWRRGHRRLLPVSREAKDGDVFLQDCQDLPRPVVTAAIEPAGMDVRDIQRGGLCGIHDAVRSRSSPLTLLGAGWVAALLARSEGPPPATSVSETRAAQTPASKPAAPAGQNPAAGPQAAATVHRRHRLHRLPRRSEEELLQHDARAYRSRAIAGVQPRVRILPRPRVGPRGRSVNRRRDSRLLEDPAA